MMRPRPTGVLAGVCVVMSVCPVALRAQQTAADSAFARAVRSPATPEVEVVGPPVAFAPGRSFGVAARSALPMGAAVAVVACVVDSAAAAAVACTPVPTPRVDRALYAVDRATDRGHDDLDGDGVAELRFTLRYTTVPAAAVGEDAYERHYVFRPTAAGPRLLLQILVREEPGASVLPRRLGRVALEDRDQDGVPDFVVRGERCAERGPDAACRPLEEWWTYRRATRTWARGAAAGASVRGAR